jgi:hypothetical protein
MPYKFLQRTKEYLISLPLITWALLSYFINFFMFFVVPSFLDTSQNLKFFPYNIMVSSPIGSDISSIVGASAAWLQSGTIIPSVYPPITLLFFVPFTILSGQALYVFVTLLILACYILITLVLPQRINKQKSISAIALLIFITGLSSYGMQLELQRGQWNVLAFTFCLTAIYIFHEHPKLRWLAYLLFSLSIQLKLYPAIFIFTLIDDLTNWKSNIRRFAGLGIGNILALFILGTGPIVSSGIAIVQTAATHVGLPYNLSITSYAAHILTFGWLPAESSLPQLFLLAVFGACFLVILWQAYKKRPKGFNPIVFLACFTGACFIPAISFDYKLALLPAAMVLVVPAFQSTGERLNRFLLIAIIIIFSGAYTSTLYSYVTKPEWAQYNLPALFVLLIICTGLSFVPSGDVPKKVLNAV